MFAYSEETDSITPRKLATVYFYCGPCPCLIKTACDICSSTNKSPHIDFLVRIDPRLSVNCCSSLGTGIDRLKSLQAASHHMVRGGKVQYWRHLDYGWTDQIVFSAEFEEQHVLSRADTVSSKRSLLNEYNLYNPGSVRRCQDVALVLGTADYLTSMMDSLDCGFHPKVPTVGQIWQVYYNTLSGSWIRKPWQQYTLSEAAYKQQKELSRLASVCPLVSTPTQEHI